VACLERQIIERTLTLASLTERVVPAHAKWVTENAASRSAAHIHCSESRATVHAAQLASVERTAAIAPLPRFSVIPQVFKPTIRTLSILLREPAFAAARDRHQLGATLDELERYLGEKPYTSVKRAATKRAVPGSVK
jgi:hypothetical protein